MRHEGAAGSYSRDDCREKFNPRARAGRDHPGRGANQHLPSFNPRARAGRDNVIAGEVTHTCEFQSTRPRGARPGVSLSAQ